MSIDFNNFTYENILNAMLDLIPDTYDKRDTAPIPTALSPAAYALEGFYYNLDRVQKQAFISTATGEALDLLGVIAGLTRYPASAAVRLGIFNIDVAIGSRFSTINGENSINFTVTAATDTPLQYQLTAETAGSIGNDYTGDILPITTIPGLTTAEITDILIAGEDEETDDEFRARIIEVLNAPAFGGNIESYRQNILDIEGVGAVQVYPTWNGGGTVKCSIVDGTYSPASGTLVDTVQEIIDPVTQGQGLGLAPIGAIVTIVAPTAVTVDVSARIVLQSGYTIEQVQAGIEAAISSYITQTASEWGTQLGTTTVQYSANIYLAKVTAAIVGIPGVANATNIRINGMSSDLTLRENGTTQEIPAMGTVTLTV